MFLLALLSHSKLTHLWPHPDFSLGIFIDPSLRRIHKSVCHGGSTQEGRTHWEKRSRSGLRTFGERECECERITNALFHSGQILAAKSHDKTSAY